MERFDTLIIGAGSSGCVLADRLTRSGTEQVLLVEAGGGFDDPMMTMPKGFGRLMQDPKRTWRARAERFVAGRAAGQETWIRGRALGGSSSINGMVYSRGHWQDYEDWAALAGPLWGWEAMKQAFVAIEDHELPPTDFRGRGGPLRVRQGRYRYPLTEVFIQAGEQMGLPRKQDLNEPDHEGIGYYNYTIDRGRRWSAAHAFLAGALRRPNLAVATGVEVERVLFEGRRAVGLVGRRDGVPVEFRCRNQVIVCCGAVNSPVILQRSGVGAAARLQAMGVPVVVDSPDVGQRLREHLGLALPHRLKGQAGLNWRLRWPGLGLSIAQYALLRGGILAAGPYEVGGFARTDPSLSRPDIQIYLGALSTGRPKPGESLPTSAVPIGDGPGLTICCHALRLTSESRIDIESPDPAVPPRIQANWLDTEEDRRTLLGMFRFMRRFMATPALAPHVGEELVPGASVQSDEEALAAVGRILTNAIHATGSCRMGTDAASVVDPQLRVRGTENLRVVDCSVMPALVSGNTNAPAIALAWRAADLWQADSAHR